MGIQSLAWECSTCRGATKLVHRNYWACVLQLLKPVCLEPVLHHEKSYHGKNSSHHKKEKPRSPQVEKARVQQQRPRATKNK